MAQKKGRWQDVSGKLYSRPTGSPQFFGNDYPMVIRPEDNWYAPPPNMGDRIMLFEDFHRKPFVARAVCTFAGISAASGGPGGGSYFTVSDAYTILRANHDFEVTGTNSSSDDVTFSAEGGIILEPDGASGDSLIIQPITGTTTTCPDMSKWDNTTWGTDQETHWGCVIKTGAAITTTTIWAGLKLTNTPTLATDANQAFFRFAPGIGTKWNYVYSISGTDYTGSGGSAVAVSTIYRLRIIIDSDRKAHFYCNETLLGVSAALTTAIDLKPYIGIHVGAATARTLTVFNEFISRNIA